MTENLQAPDWYHVSTEDLPAPASNPPLEGWEVSQVKFNEYSKYQYDKQANKDDIEAETRWAITHGRMEPLRVQKKKKREADRMGISKKKEGDGNPDRKVSF